MTGWRIGSLVGDKRVVDACSNYQSQSVSCGVPFAQKGAIEALRGPQEEVGKAVDELARRRKGALQILHSIPGIEVLDPMGAFYIWIDVTRLIGKKSPQGKLIGNSADFSAALLDDQGVAVVPGIEFGCEGYVRMGYAVAEPKLLDAMERIKKFVSGLN